MATGKPYLLSIDKETINNAFEKVREETKIPGATLALLTENYYEETLEFIDKYYYASEPINKASGTIMTKQLQEMWVELFRLNLSLIILDDKTGKIIAIRLTRITTKGDQVNINSILDAPSRRQYEFSNYCDDQAAFFDHFSTNEAFHFLALGVSDGYRHQGLATKIFKAAIDMTRYMNLKTVCIKGEGSSNFSKRIYEKFGFETLYEIAYEEWKVDGVVTIQNTGEHKSMKVYGLRVK